MEKNLDYCYASALSFRKLNLIPRDFNVGPVSRLSDSERVPQGWEILPDGNVQFRMYYPNAKSVALQFLRNEPFTIQFFRRQVICVGKTGSLPDCFQAILPGHRGSGSFSSTLPK